MPITLKPVPSEAGTTGWGVYNDTQYTEVSPLTLVAGVKVPLTIATGSSIETQLPTDVTSFWDYTTNTIKGNNGDGRLILIEFSAKPTDPSTSYLDISIDIGGSIGEIYPDTKIFPKGQGAARNIIYTISGYTLGTWEVNGGKVMLESDGAVDIYSIRAVIKRDHKGRP